MLSDEMSNRLAAQVRTCQIIVAALVAGCLIFLAIAGWRYTQQQAAVEPDVSDNTLLILAMAIPEIIGRFIVPTVITNNARRRLAADKSQTGDKLATSLIGVYQMRIITGSALLEGAALMAIAAFFMHGSPVALVAAAAVVFGLSMGTPTYDRAESWLEGQLRLVEEERSLG